MPKGATPVILAGGFGTRLRSVVSDRAKPMAEVGGRPFLEYVVRRLISHGFEDIVICASYMREGMIDYFSKKYGKNIIFAIEETPLGSAGALKNAEEFVEDRFLLIHGDTFMPISYDDLISYHIKNKADMTMTLCTMDSNRWGRVRMDGKRIVEFVEKGPETAPGLVNGSISVIEKSVLEEVPKGKICSLEKELLPKLLKTESFLLNGYTTEIKFFDMGEPEAYNYLKNNLWLLEK